MEQFRREDASGKFVGWEFDLGNGHRKGYNDRGEEVFNRYDLGDRVVETDIFNREQVVIWRDSDRQSTRIETGTGRFLGRDWRPTPGLTEHYDLNGGIGSRTWEVPPPTGSATGDMG